MKTLLAVAEGILDPAAEEHLDINLEDAVAVKAYAEHGMGILLSDDEADRILDICRGWLSGTADGTLNGTDDYYHHVEQPLDNQTEGEKWKLTGM